MSAVFTGKYCNVGAHPTPRQPLAVVGKAQRLNNDGLKAPCSCIHFFGLAMKNQRPISTVDWGVRINDWGAIFLPEVLDIGLPSFRH
jgi:hypothetical protein